jgi:hypothetical protein
MGALNRKITSLMEPVGTGAVYIIVRNMGVSISREEEAVRK